MEKIKVGITVGDANGIGLEVVLKSLQHDHILRRAVPIIYGSSKLVAYHKNILKESSLSFYSVNDDGAFKEGRVNVFNCWNDTVNIELGKMTEEAGRYAHIALDTAVDHLKSGRIDCLVTAPIHKKAMRMAGFGFPGHTEYLADSFDSEDFLMMMVHDQLRVTLGTQHIPISEVSQNLSTSLITRKINALERSLKRDFGITKPLIAVLGLNPHASDGGVMGDEESKIIEPAIEQARKSKKMVFGPFAADGFFGSSQYTKYDGILAMYHDQGLTPFKTLSGQRGVNFTAGLPIVRTSPDHGTAFEIAGQGEADESSMRNALYMAVDVQLQRGEYDDLEANSLHNKSKNKTQEKQ